MAEVPQSGSAIDDSRATNGALKCAATLRSRTAGSQDESPPLGGGDSRIRKQIQTTTSTDARPCPSFILMVVSMIVLLGLANYAVDRRRAEMATRGSPEHQRHVGIWDVRSSVDADL
jgi:hypothetical protein